MSGADDTGDDDREAILERRNRFIKTALAGIAGASVVAACSGDVVTDPADAAPSPCLKMAQDGGPTDATATDSGPQPCLKMATDAAVVDASATDAGPQPCLIPPLPDAGSD